MQNAHTTFVYTYQLYWCDCVHKSNSIAIAFVIGFCCCCCCHLKSINERIDMWTFNNMKRRRKKNSSNRLVVVWLAITSFSVITIIIILLFYLYCFFTAQLAFFSSLLNSPLNCMTFFSLVFAQLVYLIPVDT